MCSGTMPMVGCRVASIASAASFTSFCIRGHYEDFRQYIGDADKEVHFGEPALEFLGNKPDRIRISSPFVALGFGSLPVTGSSSVEARLVLTQDAQGHPQYIEATFAGLAVAEVTVSVLPVAGANRSAGNVQAELKNIVHAAYKDFAKFAREYHESLK